eukprot:scaffold7181_cov128-Skeletonema_marinoi.AAC.5
MMCRRYRAAITRKSTTQPQSLSRRPRSITDDDHHQTTTKRRLTDRIMSKTGRTTLFRGKLFED